MAKIQKGLSDAEMLKGYVEENIQHCTLYKTSLE